jgi:hypothetical protein
VEPLKMAIDFRLVDLCIIKIRSNEPDPPGELGVDIYILKDNVWNLELDQIISSNKTITNGDACRITLRNSEIINNATLNIINMDNDVTIDGSFQMEAGTTLNIFSE